MADFKRLAKLYADRIAAGETPALREQELIKVLVEIDDLTQGAGYPIREELRKRFYNDLAEALYKRGFTVEGPGLEHHGGLEWLIESTSVGNKEILELMRLVAKRPNK